MNAGNSNLNMQSKEALFQFSLMAWPIYSFIFKVFTNDGFNCHVNCLQAVQALQADHVTIKVLIIIYIIIAH